MGRWGDGVRGSTSTSLTVSYVELLSNLWGDGEMGGWGDGKPKTCGGTRPLREVAQPVTLTSRAALNTRSVRRAGGWGDGGMGRW